MNNPDKAKDEMIYIVCGLIILAVSLITTFSSFSKAKDFEKQAESAQRKKQQYLNVGDLFNNADGVPEHVKRASEDLINSAERELSEAQAEKDKYSFYGTLASIVSISALGLILWKYSRSSEENPLLRKPILSVVPVFPETKICPYCAETVRYNAIKCKHCGSMLET